MKFCVCEKKFKKYKNIFVKEKQVRAEMASLILTSGFIPREPEEITAEWLFEVINQVNPISNFILSINKTKHKSALKLGYSQQTSQIYLEQTEYVCKWDDLCSKPKQGTDNFVHYTL